MKRAISIPMIILAGLAVFSFFYPNRTSPGEPEQFISGATPGLIAAQAYILPASGAGSTPIRDTTVADPVIDANEAALYDLDTGDMLFEKNADTKAPIASLTKVLSALVAQDLFDPLDIVTVASGSIKVDGQKQTLYEGERLYVKDLIAMMLVESSNDAAYALADHARQRGIDFVAAMNTKAVTLGMTGCAFTNPAGLDDAAYCTARDLIRLVRNVMRRTPQLLNPTAQKELSVTSADGKLTHLVKNTDELLGQMSGIIGGKTGNTDGALGCLLLIVKNTSNDDTLVSIILGSRSRFIDTTKLLEWSQRAYIWND